MRSQTFVGVVLLVGLIACAAWGVAVAGDEEMCVPMGIITLQPPTTVEAKRAAVEFNHNRHFLLACNTCHHTWDGAEPITGCMTAGCHDLDALPKMAETGAVDKAQAYRYYKNAFHGQCIECHKTMQLEIRKEASTMATIDGKLPTTGPTGCIGCHPKE